MDTTPLTPFRITTDGMAPGSTVEIDGRDVTSQLRAVHFDLAAQEVARLTLFTAPMQGTIEGVAIVEQVVQEVGAAGDSVRQLDPELVRQLVAERGLTFTDDPYAATLEVVADVLDQAAEVPGG